MSSERTPRSLLGALVKRFFVTLGAMFITVLLFMLLPLIQQITETPTDTVSLLDAAEVAFTPPPPTPEVEEPEPEPEEEPPPEMQQEVQPLDLSMLELALDGGMGGDGFFGGGDFAIDLGGLTGGSDNMEEILGSSALDKKPRILQQQNPRLDKRAQKRTPGKVTVKFIVSERGRVERAQVASSSDPIFESFALAAIKKWKFKPGERNGKPVASRQKITISFPKQ